jgi:hypothetical protein
MPKCGTLMGFNLHLAPKFSKLSSFKLKNGVDFLTVYKLECQENLSSLPKQDWLTALGLHEK